jgi:hypothetical protein
MSAQPFPEVRSGRDAAWCPAIGAACDLFKHRGMKSLAGAGSNARCCGGEVCQLG